MMLLKPSLLVFTALALGSTVAAAGQRDHSQKVRRERESHAKHEAVRRVHSDKMNTIVQRHPLLFHHHVPTPRHPARRPIRAAHHKLHKVWVTPHWDKGHHHLIKGHWVWR